MTSVCIEVIYNIKCQIHLLHLNFFKYTNNKEVISKFMLEVMFPYLCLFIYYWNERRGNIKWYLILINRKFYSLFWPLLISKKYVRIMVIYHLLINYGSSGSNSRHLLFALHKEKSGLIYKERQYNIANNYIRTYGNLQQFIHWCLY